MSPGDSPLAEADFLRLSGLLEEHCGLHFHPGNRDILDAGLARMAAAEGLSVAALASGLQQPAPLLWQRFIDMVTIGETYFFRHPEQFALLGSQLLPTLLRSGRRRLRAWSAGCATGEEPYSLAMSLGSYAPGIESTVLGTDINQSALRLAAAARYGRHSLRVPSLLLDAYLQPVGAGEFVVDPAIQKRVRFAPHNLRQAGHPEPGSDGFDLIFCRNVLIYFAPAEVARVLGRLRDCLTDGGYLVVSAFDYRAPLPGLELVHIDGVPLLRRTPRAGRLLAADPPPRRPPAAAPPPPPPLLLPPAGMARAKAAADSGQLDRAAAITRSALLEQRTPEALHLLALILGEQGQRAESERLLLEAVALAPGYVLGHLSLGLLERPAAQRRRSAGYLETVVELLRRRADDEVLPGPEQLPVALARRLATTGLAQLAQGAGTVPQQP